MQIEGHSVFRPWLLPLVAITLVAISLPIQGLDWPNWRGPHYDGISREANWSHSWPAEGPKVLWRAKVGIGYSSFSVADGRVYTMGNAGRETNEDTVSCFAAATGEALWKHTYKEALGQKFYIGGPSATPTVEGDRVYTLSKSGLLYCLEAATGTVIWEKAVPELVKASIGKEAKKPTWGFAGSVVIVNDRLYVNVGKHGSALDKAGNLIWTTGPEEAGYSSHVPFTMGEQLGLAVFGAKGFAALDPRDGSELWSHPWKTSYDVNAADPIVQGNEVFVSSGYGTGAALFRVVNDLPLEVWRGKNTMRNQHNNCVLIDGFLYGFDGDKNSDLKCVEFKSGKVTWSQSGLGKGALMAADGRLIINSEKGELVIATADPNRYHELARAQILGGDCWTQPVLANGRVYLRNQKGQMACVEVTQ